MTQKVYEYIWKITEKKPSEFVVIELPNKKEATGVILLVCVSEKDFESCVGEGKKRAEL